jgi:predicted HTH domain antitoxin
MLTEICLNVDNSVFLALKEEKNDFIKNMLYSHALSLYRKNKLSLGKAAELAGYDRLDFIQRLKAEDEPIFDYDLETIKDMIVGAKTTLKMMDKPLS